MGGDALRRRHLSWDLNQEEAWEARGRGIQVSGTAKAKGKPALEGEGGEGWEGDRCPSGYSVERSVGASDSPTRSFKVSVCFPRAAWRKRPRRRGHEARRPRRGWCLGRDGEARLGGGCGEGEGTDLPMTQCGASKRTPSSGTLICQHREPGDGGGSTWG